jgi:ATP-dependent helicase HrpA
VNYGPIAPAEARSIFIREALVGGELETHAPAIRHNRALLAELEDLEERGRVRDIRVDDQVLFDFHDARLPADVHDGPTFEAWREREGDAALRLTREALLQRDPGEITEEAYPHALEIAGMRLPLSYRFEPGTADDGVTLTVPRAAIRQLPPGRCDWLVPGLRREKIEALIRSLPKQWRRQFVPAPDFARALFQRLTPDERWLTDALSEELGRMTGSAPPAEAWHPEQLDAHLHMRFRVIDEDGAELDSGRDLEALAERHGDAAARELDTGESGFEREDVTEWDFGELPETTEVERHGIWMQVHPALAVRGNRIALTVFATAEEAAPAHRAGVRMLIRRRLGGQLRDLERGLESLTRVALQFGARLDGTTFTRDLIDAAVDRAFLGERPAPRDADTFRACLEVGRPLLWAQAESLLAELDRIGERYRAVRRRIEGNLPMTWIETARDVSDQLDHLVFPGFVAATPPEWLGEYPRYLDAIARRLDVLDREPEKDRRARAEVEPLWARAKALLPDPIDLAWADPEVQQLRWQLEELRVSIFAQQLGTRMPVSVGRVEKQLQRLGG